MVDPPYYVTGSPCSYGMNNCVTQVAAPPDQLLLLDYEKPFADPELDWAGGERLYLAPRHLQRVNAVFVDGSTRTLWPWQVDPAECLWGKR